MHMMEIDMHSPSFRTLRQNKRARSPDISQNLHDRPSKRLSIAVNADTFPPLSFPLAYSTAARPVTPTHSYNGAEEHWVMRTRSLSLQQIELEQPEQHPSADTDESMNLDPDEPALQAPQPIRQQQFPVLQHPELQPPILVSHAPPLQHPCASAPPHASAFMLAAPMQATPTPPLPAGDGQAARRLRFTMGPRPDCEKCRLGVPGHYAHF
ncbi:hypothetical protein FA95DRAFT_1571826 [Auriscalpium vulgare]|uniref:Uncharacterized protein n=1 Tax=Auriscalpium vulgare TaxID=40419 RepID=A0ACB8RXK4_9AGAM|nr:hypothetical protein FA95DRAFT_1571826 [Auriscalpium vulgare]